MSTFSPNVTTKFNAAISNSVASVLTTLQTLYTCPANCFAEVQVSMDIRNIPLNAAAQIIIGTRTVGASINCSGASGWTGASMSGISGSLASFSQPVTSATGILKVAAGQSVQVQNAGGAISGAVVISGIEYKNTP